MVLMKKDCQKTIVKANDILGRTSDAILDELDDFLKSKPDGLLVYASTNDISK